MSLRDDKPILRGQPLGDGWFDLGPLSLWTSEEGLYAECNGVGIAVFLIDGQVFAVTDTCPHAEACLSAGTVQRGCVVCPGHALMFNLATGECVDDPQFTAQIFPTRILAARVHVRLA